ncbi:phosphoglycolate phosphatase [Luteimonas abyssi]|uniref:phosphoglycolate phosphatase n=1 Tax=Luteimonas abyssi TaxID=1247514 RepID=UPI000737B49D|nr:phosphoglycolate phosphatase [Luteimonas abyssi]
MSAGGFPRTVLFDLDGTLLDSAPDMLATVNRMRVQRGRSPMDLAELRPHVSKGARAMSAAAFPDADQAAMQDMIPEFLEIYREELGRHGGLFEDVATLLDALEADGVTWGVVTNKPEYLASEVLRALEWQFRCKVLVGGDSLAERKPHPLPLLHAAQTLGVEPADCVYVGDDERDIQAARAAGMPSVVALWGYRLGDDLPQDWGGDALIDRPGALLDPARWPVTPRR